MTAPILLFASGASSAADVLPAEVDGGGAGPPGYEPRNLPNGRDYFQVRDGLGNSHRKFLVEKKGRIAFLGGSITEAGGWRDGVMKYFEEKFPETEFEFVSAGIASLGSLAHSFRLEEDVLAHGVVDLIFVEAAVNDQANIPEQRDQILRGMEGVVRHLRQSHSNTDIVHLHFAMPAFLKDFREGLHPLVIALHEQVATRYGNPSLNLAREVAERIEAGQFSWERDFKDLHPSLFGHRVYRDSVCRLLDAAYSAEVPDKFKPHLVPDSIDQHSYACGRMEDVATATLGEGVLLDPSWRPSDGTPTRPGFVHVPAIVAGEPGAGFSFEFDGTACGLLVAAGPDAGRVDFRIDDGLWRIPKTHIPRNPSLHLPWALILDDELHPGHHRVTVRLSPERNPPGDTAVMIVFRLLVN